MTQGLRAVRRDALSPVADATAALDHWKAVLALSFERRGPRTVRTGSRHSGPLVVQKSLFPEGDAVCHSVILHPPGGIAGGDQLSIAVHAGPSAEVLLTTPGATRWYKANGREAAQAIHLRAAARAIVEWLPLESIVFDGADASSSLAVELDQGACAAGWEITALGRSAAGERFTRGRFRQSIEIRRDGALLWAEYGAVAGGDGLLASPAGYAGRPVAGLFWMCGAAIDAPLLAACRDAASARSPRMLAGVTCLPCGVVLARCLCESTEQARDYLLRIWTLLRPHYAGRAAAVPRLWAT
jgi:urease accessory protein